MAANKDLKYILTAELDIQKSIRNINKAIKTIQEQSSLQKIKLKFNIDQSLLQSIRSFTQAMEQISISQWTSVLSESTKETRAFQKAVDATTGSVSKQEEAMKKTASSPFLDAYKKKLQNWAVHLPLRALQTMVSTLIEVDKQMNGLKRVMDKDTNFDQMLRRSIDLSSQLGRSVAQINETMTGFARQGYKEDQVLDLTKAATLMTNLSELSGEEAIASLTSAMTHFNMVAAKSIQVVDALNAVDNQFAIDAKNLALAMTASGSAARTMGVSMEEMLGHITAIGSVTRESGSIVGESLKEIYSRLTTRSGSADALRTVGLSIAAANGEMKSATALLDELAGKWNTLSDQTQRNLAIQLAGQDQYSRFMTLMNNYQTGLRATETALNSQGSAMRDNSEYMNSLEARIQRMQTAWQELSIAFGHALVTDSLISLIQVATTLANQLAWLVDKVGVLPVVFGAAAISTIALKNVFKLFLIANANVVRSILGIVPATAIASTSLRGLIATIRTLNITWKGFLASTGIGLIAVAIGAGLEWLVGKLAATQDELEQTSTSLDRLNEQTASASRLKELSQQYDELAQKTTKTAEEKIKLSHVENELQSQFGIALHSLDEQSDAYKRNSTAIKQHLTFLQEEINLEREKASLAYRSKEASMDSQIEKQLSKTEEAKQSLDELRAKYSEFLENRDNNMAMSNEGGYFTTKLTSVIGLDPNDKNHATSMKVMGQQLAKELAEAQKKWEEQSNKLNESVRVKEKALKAEFQNYVDGMEANGVKINQSTRILFDAIASVSAKSNLKLDTLQLERLFTLFQTADIQNIDDVDRLFNNLPEGIKLTGEELESLQNILLQTSFNQMTDETDAFNRGLEQTADQTEKLQDKFQEVSSEIKKLNQVMGDLSEGQSLSGEAVADLIIQYPELAGHIEKVTDGWTIEKEALENLRKAKVQKAIDDLDSERKMTLATVVSSMSRIKAYGLELKALQGKKDALDNLEAIESKIAELDDPSLPEKYGIPEPILDAHKKGLQNISSQLKDYIEIENQIEQLERVVSDPNFGTPANHRSSSQNKTSTSQEKEAEPLPTFKQQMEDTLKQLETIDGKILETKYLMENADLNGDLHEKISLEKELNVLLEERKKKYHGVAESLRTMRDNEIIPELDQKFSDFRQGRSFTEISQVEIQKFREELELKGLKQERDLFNYYIDMIEQVNNAADDLSNKWKSDHKDGLSSRNNVFTNTLNNIRDTTSSTLEVMKKGFDESLRTMEKYPSISATYRDELSKQIDLLKQKQAAVHLEAEELRALLQDELLTIEQKKLLNDRIEELSSSWWDFNKTIENTHFKKINSLIEESANHVRKYDEALKISNERLKHLEEGTQSYTDELSKQLDILKDKLAAEEAHEKVIREQMKDVHLTEDNWNELNGQLKQSVMAQMEIATAMKDTNKTIKSQLEKLAEDVIHLYKEMYRKQKEMAIKAIEEEIKVLERAHSDKIKMIDEETKKYEEKVNAMTRAMDDQASEEDYNKELNKLLKERNELHSKIETKKLNDSREAQAELAELQKQLNEKNEQIEEFQQQRSREELKKHLQRQLEEKKKSTDKEKEIAESALQKEKERLDQLKDKTEKHYEDLLNDERKFALLREEIMKGNISSVMEKFGEFRGFILSNSQEIGNSISENMLNTMNKLSQNLSLASNNLNSEFSNIARDLDNTLIKKLEDIIAKFTTIGKMNFDNRITPSPTQETTGYYSPSSTDEQSRINEMKKNSELWHQDPINREKYQQDNQKIGSQIGATYNAPEGTWYKNGLPLFHDGGIVGGKGSSIVESLHMLFNLGSDERLSILKNGELVVKSNPITDLASKISSGLNSFSLSKLIPPVMRVNDMQKPANHIQIQIDKVMGDRKGAEEVSSIIIKTLSAKGVI
ncbi:phage tail tape measure protein [Paenibacillus sp. J2TS4]|uniref:phage tail tape measure protein n=1 Tax=Paenibacillus sp. J2TS4 TaxID=2807194 RepID=UPI001B206F7E|nr:phage tail tape measure protein [Paenibacillus sp. J2TS4]GIP32606.1 hypothetical protein J2TS4_18160 [Paenibacillus sp. J2TS4]